MLVLARSLGLRSVVFGFQITSPFFKHFSASSGPRRSRAGALVVLVCGLGESTSKWTSCTLALVVLVCGLSVSTSRWTSCTVSVS